nr:hypothetical protein [Tanacetum cinerariifolium]
MTQKRVTSYIPIPPLFGSERDRLADQSSSLEYAFELFKGRMEAMQDEQAMALAIGCTINKGIQDANYVDVVSALRTVDFSLLSVLKSKKDASIVDLMDSFHLEGPLAEIPGAEELQPSPQQLMLPIHRAEDNVVLVHSQVQRSLIGEASTSVAPATVEPITTLSTTFASFDVVPPLFVSDYQVSDAKPHDENPMS